MLKMNFFRSKVLIWSMLAAVSLLFFPHEALAQVPAGSMTGVIFADDMKLPVEGAVVKLRDVANGKEFQSTFTDKIGLYKIKGIPEGRYIVGVSSQRGDFNFDYQLIVKANETAKLSLALKPGVPDAGAGTAAQQRGKKDKKTAFFLTPLGIAIIVVSTAVLAFGVYKLFIEEEEKSPSRK